jgi:hypothetical protein
MPYLLTPASTLYFGMAMSETLPNEKVGVTEKS